MKQDKLSEPEVKYSYGPYNKMNDEQQWIRLSQGCPHDCPYCYEPTEYEVYPIPGILRNDVKILDMNLLAKPEALEIIRELGEKHVNKRVVYYEFICGIDHRFLTQEMAYALKAARFKKIRLAWDWLYKDQVKIQKAIGKLLKAGYKPDDIMVFMICNWKIPYSENLLKMDSCKVWNVKISDCYYDNQLPPNVQPVHWTDQQIKDFRYRVRKHNLLVSYRGIDPELAKKTKNDDGQERLPWEVDI